MNKRPEFETQPAPTTPRDPSTPRDQHAAQSPPRDLKTEVARGTLRDLKTQALAPTTPHDQHAARGTLRKGDDIANRLLDLAAGVLRLLPAISRHPAGFAVAKQLERCGPAGGANYEEARGAESTADFVHKVRIALKEVRETRYWLRLAVRAGLVPATEEVVHLVDEANELVAILTASSKTARQRLGTTHPPTPHSRSNSRS